MGAFVLVSVDGAAPGLADALRRGAAAVGWRTSDLTPRTWIATTGPHPPSLTRVGPWTLVGDVLNRRNARLPATAETDPWEFETKLFARFWGRFAGVRTGRGGGMDAVLRDPSGALETWVWSQEGVSVAASSAPDWLLDTLRPDWTLDLDRLSQALRDPLMSAGPLLLDGPVAVLPGTVQPLPPTEPAIVLWRPADVARRSLAPCHPVDAADAFRDAVDEAVEGLARLSSPIACEISGGLDSAIVASSLARTSPGSVALWLNAYGPTAASDERPYVRALGETLGIAPLSAPHAAGVLDEAGLMRISGDLRPGLNGLDLAHDLDWARRIAGAGAGALMTGKGGDSILLQASTPDVFTDLWRARGWRALLVPDAARLAATNEVSVWSMLRSARRDSGESRPPPLRDQALLRPPRKPHERHPWLEDCEAFGPAKTLQIAGVADSVFRHGASALTAVLDVRHPLCAQPVIEAALAIPTPVLTLGGRDRGLARAAFRDRLPALIADRRSKGDMTAIYGRMILDSLGVLRPWLIHGRLADLGLVDPVAADRLLTEESLMWRGSYAAIITAAAYEAWVRTWEARLGRWRAARRG